MRFKNKSKQKERSDRIDGAETMESVKSTEP